MEVDEDLRGKSGLKVTLTHQGIIRIRQISEDKPQGVTSMRKHWVERWVELRNHIRVSLR